MVLPDQTLRAYAQLHPNICICTFVSYAVRLLIGFSVHGKEPQVVKFSGDFHHVHHNDAVVWARKTPDIIITSYMYID